MNIKISTDSTVDLPDSILELNDISFVPFAIILGEQVMSDRVDCFPDTIYEYVAREKKLPKTSAVNTDMFDNFFKPLSEKYDAVVHVSLSSGISASYNNAVISASEFPNVYVVDGTTLSTGTALLVLYAKELSKTLQPKEIVEKLNEAKKHLQVSFVVDTMEYLYKGGRCSGLASYIASKLSIKPTIVMSPEDGKMRAGRKYMGKTVKAILKYVDDTLEKYNTPDLRRIFITHTSADEDTVAAVAQKIRDKYNFAEVIETVAGSTITSHCGKGTLGILYINKVLD